MTTEPDRMDLSPLDPELDPDRLERVVAGVLGRLGPGPVGEEPLLLDEVSLWLMGRARVLSVAAAIIALVSASLIALNPGEHGVAPATRNDAIELPFDWSAWLASGVPPRTEELLLYFPRGER